MNQGLTFLGFSFAFKLADFVIASREYFLLNCSILLILWDVIYVNNAFRSRAPYSFPYVHSDPHPRPSTPNFVSSFFFLLLFFIILESGLCCPRSHECGAIHWIMVYSPGATPLKTNLLFPRMHSFAIASRLEWGGWYALPPSMLCCWLAWSCACLMQVFLVQTITPAVSSIEQETCSVQKIQSTTLDSYDLYFLFYNLFIFIL